MLFHSFLFLMFPLFCLLQEILHSLWFSSEIQCNHMFAYHPPSFGKRAIANGFSGVQFINTNVIAFPAASGYDPFIC